MDEIDDFDRDEVPKEMRPKRQRACFRLCLDACGLPAEDAALLFGQSLSTIEKKSRGVMPMTESDAKIFSKTWHRIRTGRFDELPDSARYMAAAMLILSGKRIPPKARRGRPAFVPREAEVMS